MKKEEFLKQLTEEFPSWCSNRDRLESSWWLALEEYAKARFEETYKDRKTEERRS